MGSTDHVARVGTWHQNQIFPGPWTPKTMWTTVSSLNSEGFVKICRANFSQITIKQIGVLRPHVNPMAEPDIGAHFSSFRANSIFPGYATHWGL